MQVASLVSADRLVSDERKITQRDTSLDNPSADKAFRDLASPFERDRRDRHTFEGEFFTSAITRTRRSVALENNGPTAYSILSVCAFASAPVPFLPFPLNRTDERPIGFH